MQKTFFFGQDCILFHLFAYLYQFNIQSRQWGKSCKARILRKKIILHYENLNLIYFFNFVEIPDIYGTGIVGGSGDDLYGSGSGSHAIDGSGMEGSGFQEKSGDGSDGDDEDFNKPHRPTHGHTIMPPTIELEGSGNVNINNQNRPPIVTDPKNDPKYYNIDGNKGRFTTKPPTRRTNDRQNAGVASSPSWWCLSVVLIFIKTLQNVMG